MSLFGMGGLEIVLILLLALLVLGPGRLAEGARALGRFVRTLQRATSDVADLLELDAPPRAAPPPPPPPSLAQTYDAPQDATRPDARPPGPDDR